MTLAGHLASGVTTIARAWALERRDGVVMGFTDHDRDLTFDGIVFRADAGMTARALQQTTGLAVDNTEAVGALSADAIREADILAGRYDAAELRLWWVNWADVSQRVLKFRGSLGEVTRAGGAFKAELRGLSEVLGRPQGRVYQASCGAVLGDAGCGFDLSAPGFSVEASVTEVLEAARFMVDGLGAFVPRWFEKGRFEVLSGAAAGLVGLIRSDRNVEAGREVALWRSVGAEVVAGDQVRLVAGCDKQPETCRVKFDNFVNFRGFPHVPGEDWMMAVPREGDLNDGGRLRR